MLSSRGRLIVGRSLILVGVLLAAVLVLGASIANARQEFVGKPDPNSGYRCRITLSSQWKHLQKYSARMLTSGGHAEIFTSAPGPLRQWIDSHLWQRRSSRQMVHLVTGSFRDAGNAWHLEAGYPEPVVRSKGLPAPLRTYEHRHLLIDGCPATVLMTGYGSIRITQLLVSVPDQALVFEVEVNVNKPHGGTGLMAGAYGHFPAVLQVLQAHGAHISAKDIEGDLPK